ncbi:MAG: polysaccharide biosynthesis/export family protein [Myxococcales bacterium]
MHVAHSRSGVPLLALLALFALFGAGCSHARPLTPMTSQDDDLVTTDRIGVDDVFEVRVFGEPDLTGAYRVANDGTIDFPLAGRIQVSGISTTELQRLLVERLRAGYLKNPQVSVMMKEWNSRKISVLGQVKNPGAVSYRPNMTIVDAIVLAGGFTATADKNSVNLRREQGGGKVQTRVYPVANITEGQAPNVLVLPGDVLVVGERLF